MAAPWPAFGGPPQAIELLNHIQLLAQNAGPFRAQILAKVAACRIDQPHANHALCGNDELYMSVSIAHGHAVSSQWLSCRTEMDHPDTGGDRSGPEKKPKK